MPTTISVRRSACLGLALVIVGSSFAVAQVPTRASEPRLIPNAQPTAQVPGQPTVATPQAAAPAPAPAATDTTPPLTVVGAPAGGVTQLPSGSTQPTSSSAQAATATNRSYAVGNFALTLGGVQVGSVTSVEGGGAIADVVVEQPGPDQIPGKHIAGVRYEDISVVTGLQSKALNDWIAASWKGSAARKDGSVQAADYNLTVVSEREFMHALVTETTMPTLGGSGKEMARITVKLAPEYTRVKSGSGARLQGYPDKTTQKSWLASNFRFELDGVDGNAVSQIDSFTVRQKITANAVGELRDYEKTGGVIEFPNLKITLDAGRAQTWEAWHDDFVVKGNSDANRERSGAIVYLDATRKNELGRVSLFNCGIFRLSPVKLDPRTERNARMIAELYCERMEFSAKSS